MIHVLRDIVEPEIVSWVMGFGVETMREGDQGGFVSSHGEKVVVMDVLVLPGFLL